MPAPTVFPVPLSSANFARPHEIPLLNKEKKEIDCAEILASLELLILSHQEKESQYLPPKKESEEGHQMDWTSDSDSDTTYTPGRTSRIARRRSKKYLSGTQRNPYACPEHKRKHQKCPLDCPFRQVPIAIKPEL